MLLESKDTVSPVDMTDDDALITSYIREWKTAGDEDFIDLATDERFSRHRKDIDTLLTYTEFLKGIFKNPFEKALDFPMHPRMNLI